jgi:putative transposase
MIKVNLTQKIRIFPNPEQEEVLKVLSEKCRLIYNFALEERITAWKNDIKGIKYFKQNKDLPKIKDRFSEYKWVYSKVLQEVLRNLDANYKSFFAFWKKGVNIVP